MRNYVIGLVFLVLFVISITKEPVSDTIDAVSGSTNETYNVSIDAFGGASEDDDDHEEDDDE